MNEPTKINAHSIQTLIGAASLVVGPLLKLVRGDVSESAAASTGEPLPAG